MVLKQTVTVLIPAYNEEKVIKNTVIELKAYLDSLKHKNLVSTYEILVCINGSTDDTVKIIKILSKKNKEIKSVLIKGKGMGLALREGVKKATMENITFVAADGEVLNDFIGRALVQLRNHDFVSGSRYLVKNQIRGSSLLRLSLSIGFAFFIRTFFSSKFTESGTVKAFKRDWAQKIINKCKGVDASWQVEMLYYALISDIRITEIPVYIKIKRGSRESKVRVLSEVFSLAKTTLKFSFELRWFQLKKLFGIKS